jgi:hypothetical protein
MVGVLGALKNFLPLAISSPFVGAGFPKTYRRGKLLHPFEGVPKQILPADASAALNAKRSR